MAACETRSRTHEVGVFVELRRRLQTGLLIVGKDLAGSPADVTVTGGDSSLCVRTRRGELSLTLPAGVALEQGSCVPTPAGESCEEELHYRLRIGVERSSEEEASDSVMETLRAKETYCFHCQGCMTRLLEDRVFKRVLPLPNGNWNALVDDWCCHPDPFAKKLLPRAEDCLLGDTFLLLARDDGCDQTLTEEVSPVGAEDGQDPKKPCRRLTLISCKSCSTALGEAVAPGTRHSSGFKIKTTLMTFSQLCYMSLFLYLYLTGTLKLYFTQVVVEPAVGDRKWGASLDRSLFLERTIAARLSELSNSLCTFRFTVQTPDGKAFLLLWLLNSDSIIASVPETRVGGLKSIGPAALHSPSPGAARALKLLYVACSDTGAQQRDIVTSWEVSVIGHPVVLPLKVCEELQQVIDDSNSTLPASMRRMRSYQVAYLRL
uniref:E3 ubiquitin-protein ligase E3D n=1 Tax=Scophthalmus maximus TaxID=52904 RepID=A0A8D3A7Q2_SCOMX